MIFRGDIILQDEFDKPGIRFRTIKPRMLLTLCHLRN